MGIGFIFSNQITVLLGASGSASYLAKGLKSYFLGLLIGTLPLIWNVVIMPILQINGDKSYVKFAITSKTAINICGNLINIFIFHGGLFGMGLATSISEFSCLFILLMYFRKNEGLCHFSLSRIQPSLIVSILKNGFPRATKRACNTICGILINNWIIFIGGGVAMIAYSVQGNIYSLAAIPGLAIPGTLMLISGFLYAEYDEENLKQLVHTGMFFNILINVIVAIVIALLAPFIARLFIKDNPVAIPLAISCIYWYALRIPLTAINEFFFSFLQATQHLRAVNVYTLLNKLVYILIGSIIGGILFGSIGIFAGMTVAEILTLITIVLHIWIQNRKFPTRLEDFMLLPEEFSITKDHSLEISVKTVEEAHTVSRQIDAFCKANNIDKKRSYYAALCAEELVVNSAIHGFKEDQLNHIYIRLIYKNDDLTLRIRDNCPLFDIKKKYNQDDTTDITKNIGIRLVMKTAKDVQYMNTFNANNILITL